MLGAQTVERVGARPVSVGVLDECAGGCPQFHACAWDDGTARIGDGTSDGAPAAVNGAMARANHTRRSASR